MGTLVLSALLIVALLGFGMGAAIRAGAGNASSSSGNVSSSSGMYGAFLVDLRPASPAYQPMQPMLSAQCTWVLPGAEEDASFAAPDPQYCRASTWWRMLGEWRPVEEHQDEA